MRNHQARNFMRDQMHVSDGVLFYHSSCGFGGFLALLPLLALQMLYRLIRYIPRYSD